MKTCPQCQHTYADSSAAYCPLDGAQLAVLEELTPGTVLRRKWQIIEEIGRGGMGVVYRARHILLKEDHALKLINARYSDDPQAVRRFLGEALIARQIDHPNVARVHDAEETEDGQPYVVMEYVPGTNLRRILRPDAALPQIPLEPLRAIGIAVQVCAALAAAHQKQIVHRDIKPDNILIARNPDGGDLVKVVDFGIAKAKKELQGPWTGTQSLSQSGMFLGTPQYSSPEQARGTKGDLLDHRTDIYSLGIVLYEMLAGRPPFTGDVEDVLRQQKVASPPRPQDLQPSLKTPEELVAITMKALSKEPAARFGSADEMRIALEHAREAVRQPARIQVPREEPLAPTVPRKQQEARREAKDIPPAPEPVIKPPKPRPRISPNKTIIVVFVLTIVLGLGAYRVLVPEPSTNLQPAEDVRSPLPKAPAAKPETATRGTGRDAELSGFKFEFVKIQPGEFQMGCSPGDSECSGTEKPVHRVRITKAFEIGKYEVTQGMWESVMGSNPSNFKGADRPVEQVGWYEIQEFLGKLNQRGDGYRYRLPTEAEWEYAARAGTTGAHAVALDRAAWYGNNSGNQTHPVGQKEPNAWGLYDMAGNVWEWVEDWFDARYYANSPSVDPRGPSTGQYRVLRGGSWFSVARLVRASCRNCTVSGDRFNGLGFRCAREVIPGPGSRSD